MMSTWYPSLRSRSYGIRNSESSKPEPSKQAIFPCAISCLRSSRDRCASHVVSASRKRANGRALRGVAWVPMLSRMAHKLPMIEVGFHVFPEGGDEEVGAVREVA